MHLEPAQPPTGIFALEDSHTEGGSVPTEPVCCACLEPGRGHAPAVISLADEVTQKKKLGLAGIRELRAQQRALLCVDVEEEEEEEEVEDCKVPALDSPASSMGASSLSLSPLSRSGSSLGHSAHHTGLLNTAVLGSLPNRFTRHAVLKPLSAGA